MVRKRNDLPDRGALVDPASIGFRDAMLPLIVNVSGRRGCRLCLFRTKQAYREQAPAQDHRGTADDD